MSKRPVNVKVSLREARNDVNFLIKKFMKKVKKSGILEECKDRMYYQKPSVKNRKKKIRRKRMAKKQTTK